MADSRSILGDLDPSNSSFMELKMEPETEQGGCRREKLSQTVSDNISPESSKLIDNILEQVESLNPIERLLLYLKLPSRAQGPEIDPLRQPLNPLGSRSEITITINWIRTHLEEDPQVSLPKHEVYDEYLGYCGCNSIKPLSTADFGKVMKQVYPQVRPRRLGTRGNSRYCYAGLRKRIKLDVPGTPDISNEGRSGEGRDVDEEISSAASFLIREWVEKLLKVKVENMTELALHLLDKMYVDNRSSAACTLLSSVLRPVGQQQPQIQQQQQQTLQPQQQQLLQQQDSKLILPTLNPQNNLRVGVDPKRKLSTEPEMVNGKRSKSETMEPKFQQESDIAGYCERPDVITPNYSRISLSSRPPSSISLDKLPRKKQALAQVCMDGNMLMQNLKVEDKPQIKYKENDWTDLNEETLKAEWNNDEPADLTTHQFYIGVNEKLGSGGSSSDAQEEELVRYFTPGELENGSSQSAENKKISQLREILEKNLKSPSGGPPLGGGAFKRTSLPIREINKSEPNVVMVNPMDSTPNLSNRRRVSFNPITVTDPVSSFSTCPIPPSPGTRRRHFSFQPISPKSGALQSPPASPFVSPRSTPVHMLRSRHSSGSALPVHLLPGTGRNHHLSGCSDVSRAATYGSASESSTPFISPQGTPIPFNRSRHNSAQPRLCRSRHSSGLSLNIQYPARFNTTPYSPGALSNLNNPFSPQPSTPLQGSDQDQIYTQPGHINQFNNTNSEDPRSRHSSAGSEQAPRSAPLSPYSTTPVSGTRVRHQSAGGAIATATIHYRPSWPSNGEYSHNEDIYQTTYTTSQPPIPSPLESSMNTAPSPHHQVMHAAPSPHHQGMHNQSTLQQIHNQSYSYQEFGGDNGELDLLDLQEGLEGEDEGKGRKDGDELDLALSALRDCDTDFSKFLPEVENSTNH